MPTRHTEIQTDANTSINRLLSKLWVDLAQLPFEDKKASAKKMRGIYMVWKPPFFLRRGHTQSAGPQHSQSSADTASDLWTSAQPLLPSVCVYMCVYVSILG